VIKSLFLSITELLVKSNSSYNWVTDVAIFSMQLLRKYKLRELRLQLAFDIGMMPVYFYINFYTAFLSIC